MRNIFEYFIINNDLFFLSFFKNFLIERKLRQYDGKFVFFFLFIINFLLFIWLDGKNSKLQNEISKIFGQ